MKDLNRTHVTRMNKMFYDLSDDKMFINCYNVRQHTMSNKILIFSIYVAMYHGGIESVELEFDIPIKTEYTFNQFDLLTVIYGEIKRLNHLEILPNGEVKENKYLDFNANVLDRLRYLKLKKLKDKKTIN